MLNRDMCGRYTLTALDEQLREEFDLIVNEPLRPRYNIAPTQNVPVILATDSGRELRELRWGLVPSWAKDIKIGVGMINARSEEAANKPAFRAAMRKRRCLVPCTGFFEWKLIADDKSRHPKKQPHYIHRQDNRVFALGGLWDRWQSPDGATVESYTILTTSPNDLLRSLHDRMPVIIGREDYALWLDPIMQDVSRLTPLFPPISPEKFVVNPVSTRVNSPAHDDPACIEESA